MSDTSRELDEHFIRRAIRLAMNGRGRVEPNPMVGCVIVKDGRIIGEGYHAQFGGPHAEPTALANCTESPAGATAYVTLEPCCHTNKKTPPCTPRLIEAKIARVVIGCLDPNPDVNGKGVAMLRAAGIVVDGPVLEGEARQLIEPFLYAVQRSGPYVSLKWAESCNAKVAGSCGKPVRISGPSASRLVHELRARCDAIVVGIGTVLSDNPLLTPRDVHLRHKPIRIVLDPFMRTPIESRVVQTAREWPTVIISDELIRNPNRIALQRAGVVIHSYERAGHDHSAMDAAEARQFIGEKLGVREVLVEPGPTLAKSWLEIADRLWVFRSPHPIDDTTAPVAVPIPDPLHSTGTIQVDEDQLTEYRRPLYSEENDDLAYPVTPSADFVLARDASITSSRP
jgi:diaminohydroxyphosphoribosylaminopyrimidine deaminase/5-amino-6-(5-phosphoribosylamino)uracil reductase